MREYKFFKLANFFSNCKDKTITLEFNQIEEIIGEKLCPSAYKHIAYWQPSKTHTITKSWIQAGYKQMDINLANQTVSFKNIK